MIAINQELGRSANGFTSEVIAPSAYSVWRQCTGIAMGWESCQQEVWDKLVTQAIKLVDQNIANDAAMSAQSFARQLYIWAYGSGAEQLWSEASEQEHLAWNTVGRHIINCLDAEPGTVDPDKLEPLSVRWFRKKLEGIS